MKSDSVAVKVAFYGNLRPIAGGHLFDLSVTAPATLAHLLCAVLRQLPALRAEIVDERGTPFPYVHLFVNGRDYPFLPGRLETQLGANDRIDVFPATAGGC